MHGRTFCWYIYLVVLAPLLVVVYTSSISLRRLLHYSLRVLLKHHTCFALLVLVAEWCGSNQSTLNLRTRIHKSGLVDLGGRIIVCECVPQWFERCWGDFTKTTTKLLLFLFVKRNSWSSKKDILCRCDFWRNFLLSGKSQENYPAEIVTTKIF